MESATEKELASRQKLEEFIGGLLDRLSKAEEESQRLKRHSDQVNQSVMRFYGHNTIFMETWIL